MSACTVFFAFNGKLALAGDNEDFDHSYTQMWTVPAAEGTYGVVYFGFGRGEYPARGASMTARVRQALAGAIPIETLHAEDTYGFPQQGMNEKGLFFAGAATEAVPSDSAHTGRQQYQGVVVDLVLRRAANAKEALQLLKSYDYP
jgi:hypothetical protein